jgi:hypothetical protein
MFSLCHKDVASCHHLIYSGDVLTQHVICELGCTDYTLLT